MDKPEQPNLGLHSPASMTRLYRWNPADAAKSTDNVSSILIVLVAGFGYNLDMPLYYYLERSLRELPLDLLLVDFGYSRDAAFLSLEEAEMDRRFDRDIEAVGNWLENSLYREFRLAGKSMGTTVLLRVLERPSVSDRVSRAAWFTPGTSADAINEHLVRSSRPNLLVYGTRDKYTNPGHISNLVDAADIDIIRVENGDHALETDSIPESMDLMRSMVERTIAFLG